MFNETEQALINELMSCQKKATRFPKINFKWGHGDLYGKTLKKYQAELFQLIEDEINKGTKTIRLAISSGHGVGKTANIAMIVNYFMSCWPKTRVVMTANTGPQVRNRTFAEVIKWMRMGMSSFLFDIKAETIRAKTEGDSTAWRVEIFTWKDGCPAAIAGLHNAGTEKQKRVTLVIFDEASEIPESIFNTMEGFFTDQHMIGVFIAMGNRTMNTGPFAECFQASHPRSRNWITKVISCEDVEGIDPQFAKDILALNNGDRESDEYRVRVRGLEPKSNIDQFIPSELIERAYGKVLDPSMYQYAPVIIGVDPALSGEDSFTIALRQGLHCQILGTYKYTLDHVQMARIVGEFEDMYKAAAVVIDYGGGGTGLYDIGRINGRKWTIINSASTSFENDCRNMRAWMWKKFRQFLMDGGNLPRIERVAREAGAPTGWYKGTDYKLTIQSKDEIRKAYGFSTDNIDAIILTFCVNPSQKNLVGFEGNLNKMSNSGSQKNTYYKDLSKKYKPGPN